MVATQTSSNHASYDTFDESHIHEVQPETFIWSLKPSRSERETIPIFPWVNSKISGNNDGDKILIRIHNGRKAITERNVQLEARTKSKRAAALWASQSGIQVGKLKAWVRLLVIKILPQTSSSLWVSPTIG